MQKNTGKRYFLRLAYNGKGFSGWQKQPNADSVQANLEAALEILFKKPVQLIGAGRTDTGVHAKEMYAHFDVDEPLPVDFLKAMNGIIPKGIAIYDVQQVKSDVSARFEAISRSYLYIINQKKDPFWVDGSYYFPRSLNLEAMREAMKIIPQYSSFGAFCKAGAQNKTDLCQISDLRMEEDGYFLNISITANRFLRNMVRAIVGTLIEVGEGKLNPQDLHKVIQSGDRRKAGYSVPAHGLYLTRVEYPEEIFI